MDHVDNVDIVDTKPEALIPKHGGYRKLRSFQVAELVYDVTVRFCDRYIDRRSRTHDQMVQAARSGVQNIAEGSQASGTSKKMEMKLTNVARASLEELRRDYEDYLRQHGLPLWPRTDPRRTDLVARRCTTADQVAAWVREVHERCGPCGPGGQSGPDGPSTSSTKSTYPEIATNGALVLLAVACSLLDRQLAAQATAVEQEGGFTERLYRRRTESRAGLTLVEVCVLVVCVVILAAALVPATPSSDMSRATAMKCKGRSIWVAVISANSDVESHGGTNTFWPKAMGFDKSRTSTEYFRVLMSHTNDCPTTYINQHFTPNLTSIPFSGSGVPNAASNEQFTKDNNAWSVVCVGDESAGEAPFLITRNVDVGSQINAATSPKLAKIYPFKQEHAVWVTRGGATFDAGPHYVTAAHLFPIEPLPKNWTGC